jgi:hypothetical protein
MVLKQIIAIYSENRMKYYIISPKCKILNIANGGTRNFHCAPNSLRDYYTCMHNTEMLHFLCVLRIGYICLWRCLM